jgi:ATP-dependent Clp protease ATP-binding subunit ClpB
VEKAHPDVFNVLLQVLTTPHHRQPGPHRGFQEYDSDPDLQPRLRYHPRGHSSHSGEIAPEARAKVDALLKRSFRPEFLNRLDEIVYFKPLTKMEIRSVVGLMMKDLSRRLEDKELRLELTDEAKDFIVNEGYDPIYGARPLKRYIQRTVETLVARLIIAEDPAPGTILRVSVENGELKVTPVYGAKPVK